MIRILLLLSWLILPAAAPQPSAPAPIVRWTTGTEHDFGQLQRGATARVVFPFENLLNDPIVLQTVRTTCGCTAADWPEEPIESGKSGAVTIEFDAEREGEFRKKITVYFNKQRKAETLWISGEVY